MALPLVAPAQFDFGGGSDNSSPWKSFKLNPKTRIKLDFKNANPDMIIGLMSKTSGVTIVKDPTLKTPLTISSAKPVSLNEAFQIFSSVLDLAGYNLQKQNTILIIRKKPDKAAQPAFDPAMLQGMAAAGGDSGGDRSELKVYEIKYANATQVARVINDVYAPTAGGGNNGIQFGGGGRGRFGGGGAVSFAIPGGGGGGQGGEADGTPRTSRHPRMTIATRLSSTHLRDSKAKLKILSSNSTSRRASRSRPTSID